MKSFSPENGWTDAAKLLLKVELADEKSARQIVETLAAAGFKTTRNGVLGQIHRMRLKGELPKTERMDNVVKLSGPAAFNPAKEIPPTGCRWVIGHPGTPGWYWCDAKPLKSENPPYCAAHLAQSRRTSADDALEIITTPGEARVAKLLARPTPAVNTFED